MQHGATTTGRRKILPYNRAALRRRSRFAAGPLQPPDRIAAIRQRQGRSLCRQHGRGGGFQVDTGRGLGSNLDIDYAPALIQTHNYCSRMGLDMDMASSALAGSSRLTSAVTEPEDANGLELCWATTGRP